VIPIGIFDTHPTLPLQGILSILTHTFVTCVQIDLFPTIDVTILCGTMEEMIVVIKTTKKWFVVAYATMTYDQCLFG
jgi:hypothetical protein